MLYPHPSYDEIPLPTLNQGEIAALTSLYRERYGVVFASEGEAIESFTALLQLYYLLNTQQDLASRAGERGNTPENANPFKP